MDTGPSMYIVNIHTDNQYSYIAMQQRSFNAMSVTKTRNMHNS